MKQSKGKIDGGHVRERVVSGCREYSDLGTDVKGWCVLVLRKKKKCPNPSQAVRRVTQAPLGVHKANDANRNEVASRLAVEKALPSLNMVRIYRHRAFQFWKHVFDSCVAPVVHRPECTIMDFVYN